MVQTVRKPRLVSSTMPRNDMPCWCSDHTITYTLTANGGGAGGVAELFGQK